VRLSQISPTRHVAGAIVRAMRQPLVSTPPVMRWPLHLLVVCLLLWIAARRGAIVVVASALIALPLFWSHAVKPERFLAWSLRHPRLNGAILGLPLYLGLAAGTSLPLWACVVAGLAGVFIGMALATTGAWNKQPAGPSS
jgi:hypothetical protein